MPHPPSLCDSFTPALDNLNSQRERQNLRPNLNVRPSRTTCETKTEATLLPQKGGALLALNATWEGPWKIPTITLRRPPPSTHHPGWHSHISSPADPLKPINPSAKYIKKGVASGGPHRLHIIEPKYSLLSRCRGLHLPPTPNTHTHTYTYVRSPGKNRQW